MHRSGRAGDPRRTHDTGFRLTQKGLSNEEVHADRDPDRRRHHARVRRRRVHHEPRGLRVRRFVLVPVLQRLVRMRELSVLRRRQVLLRRRLLMRLLLGRRVLLQQVIRFSM